MKKCRCDECKLIDVLKRIVKKCTPIEAKCLLSLWERMEYAETLLQHETLKRQYGLYPARKWITTPANNSKDE